MKTFLAILLVAFPVLGWAASPTLGSPSYTKITLDDSTVSLGDITLSPSPSSFAPGEVLLQNNKGAVNVLALQNNANGGYSALTARQNDTIFPDAGESYEHMAIGFGALSLGNLPDYGLDYLEISRFTNTQNAFIPPARFALQQTGGVLKTENILAANLTVNSTTATINGSGASVGYATVWPANGSLVYPLASGFLPADTTVVSGGGTTTAVLSNAALATNGFVQCQVGTPTYGQYSAMIMQEIGRLDFLSYNNSATGTGPFSPAIMTIDRQNGAVAFNELDTNIPQALVDINGNEIVGNGDQADRYSNSPAQLNVETSNSIMFSLLQTGVNALDSVYFASPNRIALKDRNNSVYPLSLDIDGTGDASIQGSLNVGSINENAGASGSVNSVGGYYLNSVLTISPTAPTISSGFGTGDSISSANGTAQWVDNVGTSPSTSVTFSTATFAHGLSCGANDLTTPTLLVRETARTSNSITFKSYNSSGTLTAPSASDAILIGPCIGG